MLGTHVLNVPVLCEVVISTAIGRTLHCSRDLAEIVLARMDRVPQFLRQNLHRIDAQQLLPDDLDLLLWVPRELCQLGVRVRRYGRWSAAACVLKRRRWRARPDSTCHRGSVSLSCVLDPVKQWLLDEYVARVEDEALLSPDCVEDVDHRLLVEAFQWMRCDHSLNLHGQPERHQLRDHEVNTTSECNTEVDAQHLAVGCVDQEVF